MRSRLLAKPFRTWYASDIVLSDLENTIHLESLELKRRRKAQTVGKSDKTDIMESFMHKHSLQGGQGLLEINIISITLPVL